MFADDCRLGKSTARIVAMALRYPSFNRRGFVGLAGSAAAFLSCACGRALAQQPEKGGAIPGGEKSAKSTMLGAGADLLQSRGPVSAINMYLPLNERRSTQSCRSAIAPSSDLSSPPARKRS